jgi:hypothetical protein
MLHGRSELRPQHHQRMRVGVEGWSIICLSFCNVSELRHHAGRFCSLDQAGGRGGQIMHASCEHLQLQLNEGRIWYDDVG